MTWKKNNNVKYHLEDADNFCGAASLMMILGSKLPNLPVVKQGSSFPLMHEISCPSNLPSCAFAVSPDALAQGLEHFRGTLSASFHERIASNAHDMASNVVAAIYANDPIPPAVLRDGCGHWVVVCDVETDTEPVQGQDFSINKFFVNVPALGPSPVNHSASDVCGNASGFGATGIVSMYGWLHDFRPCAKLRGVAGVFSDRTAHIGTLKRPARDDLALMRRHEGRARAVTNADEASSAAKSGAIQLDPDHFDEKTIAETPHLVQRIDRVDEYYYLVRVRNDRYGADASVRLDARNGEPMEMSFDPASCEIATPEQVAAELEGDPRDRCGHAFDFGGAAPSVEPVLAWRPSRESFSPFSPFHRIVYGDRVLYRDCNGMLHESLTPLPIGA